MFGLGPSELLIIAVIVLILFGAKRLPEIGKGLGGAIREFRNVRKDLAEPPNEVEQPLGAREERGGTPRPAAPRGQTDRCRHRTGPRRQEGYGSQGQGSKDKSDPAITRRDGDPLKNHVDL